MFPQPQRRPNSWSDFPDLVKVEILELVAHHDPEVYKHADEDERRMWDDFQRTAPHDKTAMRLDVGKTNAFASVCREWQAFFEAKHFARLTLFPEDLRVFRDIVQGLRRKLVKHVWLRIRLLPYGCVDGECRYPASIATLQYNDEIFTSAMGDLFAALSIWGKSETCSEGLALELCVYSDSDSQHVFMDHNFGHDPYSEHPHLFKDLSTPTDYTDLFDADEVGEVHARHNPSHFWRHGRRRLERLIYEPPEIFYSNMRPGRYYQLCCIFEQPLPATLKELTIYENAEEEFMPYARWLQGVTANLPKPVVCNGAGMEVFKNDKATLGEVIAKASRRLEHLSASFMIDAKDFFNPSICQSLAMTSELLDPDQSPVLINNLLKKAGATAGRMPKLRTMEIWFGKWDSHGTIFRYHNDDRLGATITWQSTWRLAIEPDVIRTWTKTVYLNTRHERFNLDFEVMPMDGTSFPASVLRHLKLKDRVLHPVSYRQVQLIGSAQ
ncbi:hypothetical protein B0T22DRAFT_523732 [Podospora appendiculata]|uniref:DUF6546 domain-containing protein n=1 Tax=Podospora appendiculata TaxID=314037 RepID=A0AAE0WZQ8_9PEZI|nr:hypothetical protein B0T22DRAFT_523732 [Podospora appendiculata]